jgi:hypothetical protein
VAPKLLKSILNPCQNQASLVAVLCRTYGNRARDGRMVGSTNMTVARWASVACRALILVFAIGSATCGSRTESNDLRGVWSGTLEIRGDKSTVFFEVAANAEGKLTAVFDNPEQHV